MSPAHAEAAGLLRLSPARGGHGRAEGRPEPGGLGACRPGAPSSRVLDRSHVPAAHSRHGPARLGRAAHRWVRAARPPNRGDGSVVLARLTLDSYLSTNEPTSLAQAQHACTRPTSPNPDTSSHAHVPPGNTRPGLTPRGYNRRRLPATCLSALLRRTVTARPARRPGTACREAQLSHRKHGFRPGSSWVALARRVHPRLLGSPGPHWRVSTGKQTNLQ